LPEIKVGLWPFLVYRSVSAAIGPRRALTLSLSGRSFAAEQARKWGLVYRVLPAVETEDRGRAMARHLAKASPQALALGMQYVRDSAGKSWEQAGELAATLRRKLMETDDFEEGLLAFRQKRDARWPSMPAGSHDSLSGPST
jgi:enoyl-CoA hydratase/carnithine racemase